MKNQYAGDVGDYTKLGVLRAIEKAGFSIGLNWYLTPDEPEHSKTFTDANTLVFWIRNVILLIKICIPH